MSLPYPTSAPTGPRREAPTVTTAPPRSAQPQFRIPRRAFECGSFLFTDEYRQRYRPAGRR